MGSEKSVTQVGNGSVGKAENENVGVGIGNGVFVDGGVKDGIIEGVSVASVENSLTPQAKVRKIVLIERNKSFKSFIFPFLTMVGHFS
jgi:hypothetical protein